MLVCFRVRAQEFLVALVRVAINMYILPGQMDDVSDALDELLDVVVACRLGSVVVHSNAQYLYSLAF